MTPDTTVIIGVYIAPSRGIAGRCSLYGILWAVDHTVITFEADAAAHTAVGLRPGLLFGQAVETLLKVPEHFVGTDMALLSQIPGRVFKMTKEKLV